MFGKNKKEEMLPAIPNPQAQQPGQNIVPQSIEEPQIPEQVPELPSAEQVNGKARLVSIELLENGLKKYSFIATSDMGQVGEEFDI